jgi:aldose 1-epimerase
MESRKFGSMPDGADVVEVVLAAGDLRVKVINFGAVIRDVRLAGIARPLVLGFERLDDYLAHSPHFGAVAGRSANRIAGGRLMIDGRRYQLSLNENGRTHLHGGFKGFGVRAWRVVANDPRSVTLAISAEDGEEGYPGRVEAICRYAIEPPATIRIEFEATSDAPTIVNLAQHSYFNLSGDDTILDHRVMIRADAYTPFDVDKIPTGAILPVAGTPYDFRALRPIRRTNGASRFEYDINYVVGRAATRPRPVARLVSPRGDVALDVASTEPGLQFYDGCMMKEIPVPGLDGKRYGLNAGCCFEPQVFPDSPNHPGFPSAVLRPGGTYRQTTLFAFERVADGE